MTKKKKEAILIVEDEPTLLRVIAEKLTHEGFHALEAKNGKEGIALAVKKRPDLILLDIIMPVMDGMTMLAKLRKDAWGKNVPVVILTNLSDEKKVGDAIEKGVFDYLVKSDWTLEDVVKKVKKRLKKK
ncbi:MAG: hypothetical protein A3C90_00610 [Candidatus Magasanikbacteria bacterium RIFCSPHIGHO2_02_FULL_51_14]|uniref:Response regulatory domain-containing protein n=1 Tax=Candidatus Magasanikbacteria bacterium RIFCSPHIGHO2_02_FULL_51_14 TaxID=1798683 RepID=A0A1F6MFJ1_9BACT|nr:MAG: hypothetical protein A3C90_00610 [Candidatus Magasanikbacteria bacterium RIFCSPHIGHO2_02_FULL_51_14]